jgi:hypothetical protein
MTNAPTQTGRGAQNCYLVLLRGPSGRSRTFNRLLGDRRSSVERDKNSAPTAEQPKRALPLGDFGAFSRVERDSARRSR